VYTIFITEALLLAFLEIPRTATFTWFGFGDLGVNLALQSMLDRGLAPTVDFSYIYGLLSIPATRAWLSLFGRTPWAYLGAMMVFNMLVAWGVARCALALRSGFPGLALFCFAMPNLRTLGYTTFAHATEAVLICHALAEHAAGRRSKALTLLTICLFFKPAMAYLYGCLLVLLLLRRAGGVEGWRSFAASLVPAAAVGLILAGVTIAGYGPSALVETALPLRATANYRLMNYGFFTGTGRDFWLPEEPTLFYYVWSPAGHYLIGTIILMTVGLASLVRLARNREDLNAEIVVCTALIHILYITMLYAGRMSWTYYYSLMIVGLAALASRGRSFALLVTVLAVLTLMGFRFGQAYIRTGWTQLQRTAETAGLWTEAEVIAEWRQVLSALDGRRTAVLSIQGGGLPEILPGFAQSEILYPNRGLPLETELRRKLHQVATAEAVLIYNEVDPDAFLRLWPEFREAIGGHERVLMGERFQVFLKPPTVDQRVPTRSNTRSRESD
jgi:hypothetical protein